jgi:micrococcal nuclease
MTDAYPVAVPACKPNRGRTVNPETKSRAASVVVIRAALARIGSARGRQFPRACLISAWVVIAAACRSDSGEPPVESRCTVASITDGDTLRCVEGGERVRLLLIDAPEVAQAPWGALATDELRQVAPPGTVTTIETDVEPRDGFGRLLAYLYLPDRRMANEEMARRGFAVLLVYAPNGRHVERIRAAVEDARAARRGLWATPAFDCLPVDFRAGRCSRAPS